MQGGLVDTGEQTRLLGIPASRLAAVASVGAIVLLALWLRWDRLQYTEFGPDQSTSLARVYDFVVNGQFPLHGAGSSTGGSQGPVESWLLALPFALSKDPVVATASVGLLLTVAVGLTYFVVARYFDQLTGLAAALLFAVNPWALHYSRKVWAPDPLPLFTILFFGALLAALSERRRCGLTLAFLWLAFAFFTHPQAVGFAPILLLAVTLRWRQAGVGPIALGLALALLVGTPFLIYQSQHDYFDLRAVFNAATGGNALLTLDSLNYVALMASAWGFPDLLEFSFRSNATYPDMTLSNTYAIGLLGAGFAVSLWRTVPRRSGGCWVLPCGWEKYLLLVLWVALPVALQVRHSVTQYPHYFIYALPAQYVLIGVALAWLGSAAATIAPRLRVEPRYLRVSVVGASVLFLGVSQVLFFRTYLDHVEMLGPVRPYGTPLVYSQRAMETMRELRAELGGPTLSAYGFLYRDTLDYLARPDLELHHVDRPFEIVLPREPGSGQLAMLCADDNTFAWRTGGTFFDFYATKDDGPIVPHLLDLGFTELADRIVLGPDGFVYFRFFYLSPAAEANMYASFTKPAGSFVLNNGMRLVGYSFQQRTYAGGAVPVRLLWDLPRDRSGEVYAEHNLFLHALDHRGTVVAQKDWELVQYLDWRVDGLVVTEHELPIPDCVAPSVLWLDLGAYERYGRQTVPWRDAAGKETSQALKVGPVKVTAASAPAAPEVTVGQRFGDWLELEGYDLAQPVARAGDSVGIRLHWRAVAQPPGDYVVSVQLLAEDGRLVAQHDSPPAGGNYPTSYWVAGELVIDAHHILLPKDLPPGQYVSQVVVYSAEGQKRLPAGGVDSARLGTLSVR